ncbi:MAG: hypothetical protein EBT45_08325, partial [Alphaproteobacteria bacterium]|nr:hypothetical protein [Alphaproteobacteria bacterium]
MVLVLVLLGALLALILSYFYYSSVFEELNIAKYCGLGSDCGWALDSPYSSLFGVPVSVYAFFYVVVWGICWWRKWEIIFFLTLLSSLISLSFLTLLIVEQKNCPYCLGFHLINLSLSVITLKMRPWRISFSQTLLKQLMFLKAFYCFFIILTNEGIKYSVRWITFSEDMEISKSSISMKEFSSFGVGIQSSRKSKGQITFFLDLGCRYCKEHLKNFLTFQARYPAFNALIYPYDVEGRCSSFDQKVPDHSSCTVMALLYCLPDKHRYEFLKNLMDDQIWSLNSRKMIVDYYDYFFKTKEI